MPRQLNNSAAIKREKLRHERKIKADKIAAEAAGLHYERPNVDPSAFRHPESRVKDRRAANRYISEEEKARQRTHDKASGFESQFLKLSDHLQTVYKRRAANDPIIRPIDNVSATLGPEATQPSDYPVLTCPVRPPWSYKSVKSVRESM